MSNSVNAIEELINKNITVSKIHFKEFAVFFYPLSHNCIHLSTMLQLQNVLFVVLVQEK